MRLVIPLLALLVATPGWAKSPKSKRGKQPGAAAPAEVTFHFALADTTAKVTGHAVETVRDGGKLSRKYSIDWTGRVVVTRDGEDTLVRTHDTVFDSEIEASQQPQVEAWMSSFMKDISGLESTERLGPDGTLQEIMPSSTYDDGLIKAFGRVKSTLDGVISEKPEMAAGLAPLLATVEPDAVKARMFTTQQQRWLDLVGFWVGATLDIGELYEMRQPLSHPMLQEGQTLEQFDTFQVHEWVPCSKKARTLDCVKVTRESWQTPETLRALTESQTRTVLAAMPGGSDAIVSKFDQRTKWTLIVDPSTMRTWHYTKLESKTIGVEFGGQTNERVEEKRLSQSSSWR